MQAAFPLSKTILGADIEHNIGRMAFWRNGRWFVDQLNSSAYLMMMQHSWIKNVFILHTRPNKYVNSTLPTLCHQANINDDMPRSHRGLWTENGGYSSQRIGEKRVGLSYWDRFEFYRTANFCCGCLPNVFPVHPENILSEDIVEDVQSRFESLPEYIGTQLPLSDLLRAPYQVASSEPQEKSSDKKTTVKRAISVSVILSL